MTGVKPSPPPPGSRRERARAATRTEIVTASRTLLVAGGIEAVTLRAIAGELGLTAPALYRYFDSREELLGELINVVYDELADALIATRDADPGMALADKFMVTSFRFRQWALEHRAEFGLLFGAPLPGVGEQLAQRPVTEDRGARFGQVWLELFVELWRENPPAVPRPSEIPAKLRAQLKAYHEQIGKIVPIGALVLYLAAWMQLYGAVATETFGHLNFAFADGADAEELFRDVLQTIAQRIGLKPPA